MATTTTAPTTTPTDHKTEVAKPKETKQDSKEPVADTSSAEPLLKYKTWVLKVSIHCEACKRKVKKILHNIDGVYTTNIDLRQQRVTVIGNVESETLLKNLVKRTGKHAELWPESNNNSPKEKKSGKAKSKDKQPQQESSNDETLKAEQQDHSVSKEPAVRFESAPPGKQSPGGQAKVATGQTVTVLTGHQSPPPHSESRSPVGAPENGAGSSSGKKKKKKGQKGNSNVNAAAGAAVINEGSHVAFDAHAGGANHSPPRQDEANRCFPQQNHVGVAQCYPPPIYGVSYSTAQPMSGYGASYYYYASPPPHSYRYVTSEAEHQPHDVDSYAPSQPSDSFELFSDENPNGCSVM